MNWFTREIIIGTDEGKKKKAAKLDSLCEHVEADPSKLHCIVSECDPWGCESTGICEACDQEHMANTMHRCAYCGESFSELECHPWAPFDFSAAQGDEVIWVCENCLTCKAHMDRVKRDEENMEYELNH